MPVEDHTAHLGIGRFRAFQGSGCFRPCLVGFSLGFFFFWGGGGGGRVHILALLGLREEVVLGTFERGLKGPI